MDGAWSWPAAFGVYGLLFVAPWCGVFHKAGKRWWVALLPVINVLVLLRVVGRPWWWVLLLLVPVVNLAVWTVICLDTAESFGHGLGYTVGLFFLPFVFATAVWLGGSTYGGPVVAQARAETSGQRIGAGT